MMPLLCLLSAAVPANTASEKSPAPLGYEVVVNTSPDAIQVLLIVLASVAVIAVIALIAYLLTSQTANHSRRRLTRRMMQDQAFLQSAYFNTASGIVNEAMRHKR